MTKNFKLLFSRESATTVLEKHLRRNNSGRKRVKVESQYGKALRESRKISKFYGNLSKKCVEKLFRQNASLSSKTSENMLCLLESRLDIVLYRAAFFETIKSARQMISGGGIRVNQKKVISHGYIVTPGDIVSVSGKNNKTILFEKFAAKNRFIDKSLPISLSNIIQNSESLSITSFERSNIKNKVKNLQQEHSLTMKKENQRERKDLILLKYLSPIKSVAQDKEDPKTPMLLKKSKAIYNIQSLKQIKWVFKLSPSLLSILTENKVITLINTIKKAGETSRLNSLRKKNALSTFVEDKLSKKESFLSFLSLFNKRSIVYNDTSFFKNKMSFLSPVHSSLVHSEKEKFTFFSYLLYMKKHLLRKVKDFRSREKNFFTKQNKLSLLKKTKAQHLEISYQSLSIIFLFPPQRICFPHFINLSLIYK